MGRIRVSVVALSVVVTGASAYGLGHSRGGRAARAYLVPKTELGAAKAEVGALQNDLRAAENEANTRHVACLRSLEHLAVEWDVLQGTMRGVVDSLTAGDREAAEDWWNGYYQGLAFSEYHQTAFIDDLKNCGVKRKLISRVS